MKNLNHIALIEELYKNKDLLEEFKLFFYNNKRKGVMLKYNLTQAGTEAVLKEFNIKVPKELSTSRRKATCLKIYGAESVPQSEYFSIKSKETCLDHFGVDHPNKCSDIVQKGKQTKLARYDDENFNNSNKANETKNNRSQEEKDAEINKRKATNQIKYGGNAPACSPLVQEKMRKTNEINNSDPNYRNVNKCYETKKLNNSFNTSKPEEEYYSYLCNKYGKEYIIRQYRDSRYSNKSGKMWSCDFYIISKDLFIELNKFPTHYSERFDPSNEEHIKLLEHCKNEPSNWIEEGMVRVWAGSDYEKIKTAQENNLNYITIY